MYIPGEGQDYNNIRHQINVERNIRIWYNSCMTTHILTKTERTEQKSRNFLKTLNILPLEMVLDWLHRASYALQDSETLTLKHYLEETKEVALATIRMNKIDGILQNLTYEESQRRERILEEQKRPFLNNLDGMV